jgi:hypothetical protein
LTAEWAAATGAVRERHINLLWTRYGIPPTAIIDRLGVARVHTESSLYDPADGGTEMAIVGCFAAPPRMPDGRWRFPNDVVDLIAFRPAEPSRWWSRCDFIAALGEESLPAFSDDPVHVRRNPLAWLQSGAAGICPVSPDPAAVRDVLIRLPGIVAEDVNHGRKIERLMARHWNEMPAIYVTERARGAA